VEHPFCISLKVIVVCHLLNKVVLFQFAFQDDYFLFYVLEYAAGGMLFYHLVRILIGNFTLIYLLERGRTISRTQSKILYWRDNFSA
jgi:hypothetical protein